MKVGEEKRIQVNPADGYGSVNRDAFLEVPKDKLPPEALKLRTILIAQDSQVRESRCVFMKSKNATVIMDFNHPMTGKTLSLDVKVSEIKTPEK